MLGVAPFQFDHARRVGPGGGPADHVDHGKFTLQQIAPGNPHLRAERLAERFGLRFELARPHVLGRSVDEIADEFDRLGLGDCRVDGAWFAGQQDARGVVGGVGLVAIEPVLAGDPAEHRRARLAAGATIGTARKDIGEPGHAPA